MDTNEELRELKLLIRKLAESKEIPSRFRVALFAISRYQFARSTYVGQAEFSKFLGMKQPNVSTALKDAGVTLKLWTKRQEGQRTLRRLMTDAQRKAKSKAKK